MKKIIIIFAFLLISLFAASDANAEARTESAKLASAKVEKSNLLDVRTKALENVFRKYNSHLADYAWAYVKYADEYSVDWRLLPAISGLESSFGKFYMPGSYNAYGWGGGYIYFESWEDGIRVINKTLRENYMNKWGAKDVWEIGPIYAESPTWSVRVNRFMEEIEAEHKRLSLFSNLPTI